MFEYRRIHKNGVATFINNLYNSDGSFKFLPNSDINNLYSTCFAVLALDLINELKNYSFADKKKMVAYIQKHQSKINGLFEDLTAIPKKGSLHDIEYINLQLTDFSQMALSTLNSKPRYRYIFLKKYKNLNYLENWLNNLSWNSPWFVSNQIMFILNSLIYEQEYTSKNNNAFISFIID